MFVATDSIYKEKTLMEEEQCKTAERAIGGDVEEGEISDSASVEEISEEAFNQSPSTTTVASTVSTVAVSKVSSNGGVSSDPKTARVWTMRDLYSNYPISSVHARGLYNLAWAQAVQNKPLDELFVMKKADTDSSGEESKTVNDKVVIDVEDDVKEEGELEEGEIDLDSEVVENGDLKEVDSAKMAVDDVEKKVDSVAMATCDVEKKVDSAEMAACDVEKKVDSAEMAVDDVGKKVELIREGLQSVSVEEAEKDFNGVCSKLQRLLDSLHEINSENSLPEKDDLTELFMTAIQTAIAAFCSMEQTDKEKHKDHLSRVLVGVSSKKSPLFSTEQLNEVGELILSLDPSSVSSRTEDGDKDSEMQLVDPSSVPSRTEDGNKDSEMQLVEVVNVDDKKTSISDAILDSSSIKIHDLKSESAKSLDHNESNLSLESSRQGVANSKLRGLSLPLLDLHKDHDLDSLPSPTRESQPTFPIDKVAKPEFPSPAGVLRTGNSVTHPYETDALKAVSSYQQKFGRSSFFMTDRLPSPTPSEDGDKGDADIGEEISSSVAENHNFSNAFVPRQPVVSSAPNMSAAGGKALSNITIAGSTGLAATPVSRSSPVKIRDPRLRSLNSDAPAQSFNQCLVPMSNNETRKQKTVDEPFLGGPAMKRQRSEQTDSVIVSDKPSYNGTSGWSGSRGDGGFPITNSNSLLNSIKDASKLDHIAAAVTAATSAPSVSINAVENLPATNASAAAIQSLLQDIAVNPSLWNKFLEQQKPIEAPKITTQPVSSSNCIIGGVNPMNVAPPKTSVSDPRQGGIIPAPPQTAISKDDLAKIRLKRRDPRRALHNPSIQKVDQSSPSIPNPQGITVSSSVERQEDQLNKSALPNSSAAPDISHQFTSNLKNLADIISVSQPSVSSPLAPQTPSTVPINVHHGKLEGKGVVSESSQPSASEMASVVPYRPQSSWADVEHLFEGFDDHQRAAIQRERTRRIEEQKKMFAARKLCLVLDLDHTLLNSAKFIEVDPVHDEILRKKEEQDREKPQRHLFRFPHMGMWTKLRPGIWNFLEKASKLFELHLYTMGNKLYATEMAKLLDPKGEIFAGRVISRGDDADLVDGDERVPKSKDLEGVLGMESAVVIIDDSFRVWPHNKLNLIVVERYIYFPCSRRQFGLPGPSLLEIDHDERAEDGTLASSLGVIERIHQNFFAHQSLDEADVRNILATEQRKILAGCRIVFSRVFPVGEVNPHLHPLWQTAQQFGAVCTNQIDDNVTHVVANSPGTDKVNWALATGRFVVHPGWVEASALLYRRANEHDFAIKQP